MTLNKKSTKHISPHALFDKASGGNVQITSNFWKPRQETIRSIALPAQWEQLEKYKTLDNFRVTAGVRNGTFYGPFFVDSDLYKWLEAASYVLGKHPDDDALSDRVKEVVSLIENSQMDDGYINAHYQTFAPERRWTNLLYHHELYCAGHLIEAACAHNHSTGNDTFLKVAIKLADHICHRFGPGKDQGVPGHEEIELALIRLYRITGEKRYLDTANFFVHQRGRNKGFGKQLLAAIRQNFTISKIRKKKMAPHPPAPKGPPFSSVGLKDMKLTSLPRGIASFFSSKYFQLHKPLMEQDVAVGHSVRAMYFYAGAADLYLENGDKELLDVLKLIWKNTAEKRTYITGGIGSLTISEGFGRDHELPNKSYTETCAAIASFFYSWRLLKATGDGAYSNLMEHTLYNAILSGISLEGDNYFYQNPLVSYGATKRKRWYLAACCPPNIARLFASLENYIYGTDNEDIWVHQYIGSEANLSVSGCNVRLTMESGLPFEGNIRISVLTDKPANFCLYIRKPGWSTSFDVKVNGESYADLPERECYICIKRKWCEPHCQKDGDIVEIRLQMKPRLIPSKPEVRPNRGKVALMYGPLLYCFEDRDNPGLNVHKITLGKEPGLTTENAPGFLGGITLVKGKTRDGMVFRAIPYYAWANRGESHMEVWVRKQT